ncbi:uncharacterized protein [Nicotiana sylvestris]|uniref:uncharacterized protein n=1 Tax=Nicotiana sylvestris TaxID=4096 RepID=UPI00388CB149
MVKLAVTKAKTAIFGRLYKELGNKGGEKKSFRLAKATKKKARGLDQVRCIIDEDGRVLMGEAHIKQRWQTYFHKLQNKEGDRDIVVGELGHFEGYRDFGYCRRIKVEEVVGAMCKMSRGRATGPDEILGYEDLYMVFIDLEKAYDKVPREVLRRCLKAKGVSVAYIMVSKDMYDGAKTRARTMGGDSEHFSIVMDLHQGSVLSQFLLALMVSTRATRLDGRPPVPPAVVTRGRGHSHGCGRGRIARAAPADPSAAPVQDQVPAMDAPAAPA